MQNREVYEAQCVGVQITKRMFDDNIMHAHGPHFICSEIWFSLLPMRSGQGGDRDVT